MKIRYKLILMFILIILFASLPLSLFILHEQEREKIEAAKQLGSIFSNILTQTVLNVILANGGEIKPIQIDVKDMVKVYTILSKYGLIYADAMLISSKEAYNGIVLTEYYVGDDGKKFKHADKKISGDEVMRLRKQGSFRQIIAPGSDDVCFEFVSTGSLPGRPPLCIGRLVFSQSIIIAPVRKLHRLIYYAMGAAIFIVGLLGFVFSRFISKPIDKLIAATKKIEEGDFEHQLPIRSQDELGRLSNTYNHMLEIINQKIAELERTNERLLRLDIHKNEFLESISHELQGPLYGIIGISESLLKGATGTLNSDTNHDLSLIVSSGRRLARLVEDILDFLKLKHHDLLLNREPINLYDATQLVISIVRPLTEKKSITIKNRIHPQTSIVSGDKNRIQQILLNLISNAIKFTERGSISIEARDDENDHGRLAISVSDTGIGITPEQKGQIFDSFENTAASPGRTSTGLGLAITKKLVELHEGKIWVESEPGEGSEFIFTLEKSTGNIRTFENNDGITAKQKMYGMQQGNYRLARRADEGRTRAAHKMILAVDNDPVNLQVIINHLTLEGYSVITAEQYADIFTLIEHGNIPDLILLDIMLPRISGYDICRKIRRQYSAKELPIIMLTPKNSTADIMTGIAAGANDYITKPVNSNELIARVQSLIMMKESGKVQSELNMFKIQMDLATEIQKSIVPYDIPHLKNINFGVWYEPSELVGGDLYDYHVIDDKRIAVLVADVAGHGIPAAMVSAMLQVVYTFYKTEFTNPPVLFSKINTIMSKYSHGFYLTACCIYIDLKAMKLYHSNAGHRPLLIWRRGEGRLILDKIFDRPIGIFAETEFAVNQIDLMNNDRIIMYTDGIIESRNPNKELFGDERFQSLIREKHALNPDEFSGYVINAVKQWSGKKSDESLVDDITLIVMDIVKDDNGA